MTKISTVLLCAIVVAGVFKNCVCAPATSPITDDAGDIFDLSYSYDNTTIYWPDTEKAGFTFYLESLVRIDQPGFFAEAKWFRSADHGGTHVDAPSHFAKDGDDVSKLTLSRLRGPAVVIDVSTKAASNPDYLATMDDINAWVQRCGPIPQGAFVLLHSGWGSKWPNKTAVFGSANHQDTSTHHFPGLDPQTVQQLIQNNAIKGIGVDTPSTDYGQQSGSPNHRALAANGLVGIENVANLAKVAGVCRLKLMVLPMNIVGGTGAPARIVAIRES